MVLDSLDGRVARMTNTQSAFGEQMDSLVRHGFIRRSACIDFLRLWTLKGTGSLGVDRGLCILRMRCALRLARFNVNTAVVDKRFLPGACLHPLRLHWWHWLYRIDDRSGHHRRIVLK
jgi:CDP-diacylglycerol--serine O-phosphatidyltransferase